MPNTPFPIPERRPPSPLKSGMFAAVLIPAPLKLAFVIV
jgi:hypothetical protein